MNRIYKYFLIIFLVFGISACGSSKNFRKPSDQNRSLVIGYIDMTEAPTKLVWAKMRQISPEVKKPYRRFWTKDGMIMSYDIPPGVYKMHKLGGSRKFSASETVYKFPRAGRSQLDMVIKKPGVYYIGSYKYKEIKQSVAAQIFKKQQKFDIVRTKTPTELELLKRLLPLIDEPYWKSMVVNKIRRLEGRR